MNPPPNLRIKKEATNFMVHLQSFGFIFNMMHLRVNGDKWSYFHKDQDEHPHEKLSHTMRYLIYN
jgi:hypothetical protein